MANKGFKWDKFKHPEKAAIELAISYEKSQGRQARSVEFKDKADKGKYNGCDLKSIFSDRKKEITIEVKGVTREHHIPDSFISEFDEKTQEMKSDFMYVFYFPRNIDWEHVQKGKYWSKVKFYIIPKGAIKPEDLSIKKAWRISCSFAKQKMENFIVK